MPEAAQLLKMLESQTAAQRGRRQMAAPAGLRSDAFRYGSLIAIVVFGLGSIGLMEWFLSQLPKPPHPAAAVPGAGTTPGNQSYKQNN